jgi:hypothetical protein
MTSPGAVCPATVRKGLENRKSPEVMGNRPATRKTHVRGPVAMTQARSEPAPESLRLVTSITAPPRPPSEAAPPPCAPGKAASDVLGAGVGVGTGVGVGGAGGCAGGGQPEIVITGIVPADEKSTVQPTGATTCIGTVTFTTPLAVVVALVCARVGTA